MSSRQNIVPEDFASVQYRVNRERPCPVCGKPDWCLSDYETWAICQRVEQGDRWQGAGWLHKLDGWNDVASRKNGHRSARVVRRNRQNRIPPPLPPDLPSRLAQAPEGSSWLWQTVEAAHEAYSGLPEAKSHPDASSFLLSDYGLALEAIPDEWRVFDHPNLGQGIVYPGRSTDGSLIFKFKSLSRDDKHKRHSRYLFGNGGATYYIGDDSCALIVVAGEEKAAAAAAAGYSVLCPLDGEKPLSAEWSSILAEHGPVAVIFANDADKAGKDANDGGARNLMDAGFPAERIHVIGWPDDAKQGLDLSDVLKESGRLDVLAEFLAQAPVWPARERLGLESFLNPIEILGLPAPDDSAVGDNAIIFGDLSLVIGPPACGKSRLVAQLFVDAAWGRHWMGVLPIVADLRGLFIQNENSVRRWSHDFSRMLDGSPRHVRDRLARSLQIFVPQKPGERNLSFDNRATFARMKAAVRLYRPNLIVCDPYASIFAGDDENSNAQGNEMVDLLFDLASASPGAGILVLHHSRVGKTAAAGAIGWDKAAYLRGAKALMAACRSQINLAPGDEDGESVLVSHAKCSNSKPFETFAIRMNSESMTYSQDPDFDIEAWKYETGEKRKKQEPLTDGNVVSALRGLGGQSTRGDLTSAIMHSFQRGRTKAYQAVKSALTSGVILDSGGLICEPKS